LRSEDDTIGVALVGYGYAGRTFHAPLIQASPGMELKAVVSSQDNLDLRPDITVARSLDQALSDPAIRLVVLATPNAVHAPQALQALEAGRDVVVDKPFALTLSEAQAVVDRATERGRMVSVFHNRRWDADFLTLHRLINTGNLGPVTRLDSSFNRYRPQVRDRWRERDEPGAGIWFDLGPHLIDQALMLFGPPIGITADIAIQRTGGQAADYAHATLRYDRLRVVLHTDMMSAAPVPRFAVQGEKAGFICWGLDVQEDQLKAGQVPGSPGWGLPADPGILTDGETGASTAVTGPAGDYRHFYDGVAQALLQGSEPPVTAQQALSVMQVLEAGALSSERRAEVLLPL
jgi:predicted dehydrogenase